ncbi:MAG: dockerin type I repeat-containing protein [Clostridia bacterium]|nr:dockerin type I repeat-containing protein [Clostridia bacterium]
MKNAKTIKWLLILACLLAALFALTLAANAEIVNSLGDVDGDGNITSADARLALRASVKLEKEIVEGTAAFKAADVNKNGIIGSDDARTILRVSVKLETFDENENGGDDHSEDVLGVWCNYNSLVSYQDFYPKITFNGDHSFSFRVNLYAGMSDVKGTYEVKENRIYCTVKERNFSGFAGDTVNEFVFKINDNELIYEGETIGMTETGDAFKKYNGENENDEGNNNEDVLGIWCNYNSLVSYQEFYPKITFNGDYSFLFRVNLYAGMGDVKGTYEIKGNRIYCTVKERSFSGFAGDAVNEFVFKINDNELIYEGETIGMTISGDRFFLI